MDQPTKFRQIVGAAGVVFALGAYAADPVDRVLQLPFGKPLDRDIMACSTGTKRVADYCSLEGRYKRSKSRKGLSLMLMPPPSDSAYSVPEWVAVDIVNVSIDSSGNVERIMARTNGPAKQDEVIASIASRFGRPDSIDVLQKQNAFGARATVKRAAWNLPAIHIYHDCLELNQCVVAFSVPKESAARPSPPRPSAP